MDIREQLRNNLIELEAEYEELEQELSEHPQHEKTITSKMLRIALHYEKLEKGLRMLVENSNAETALTKERVKSD